jgi:hypothetical protein
VVNVDTGYVCATSPLPAKHLRSVTL